MIEYFSTGQRTDFEVEYYFKKPNYIVFETQSLKPYLNGTMVQIGVLKQEQPVVSFEFLNSFLT